MILILHMRELMLAPHLCWIPVAPTDSNWNWPPISQFDPKIEAPKITGHLQKFGGWLTSARSCRKSPKEMKIEWRSPDWVLCLYAQKLSYYHLALKNRKLSMNTKGNNSAMKQESSHSIKITHAFVFYTLKSYTSVAIIKLFLMPPMGKWFWRVLRPTSIST